MKIETVVMINDEQWQCTCCQTVFSPDEAELAAGIHVVACPVCAARRLPLLFDRDEIAALVQAGFAEWAQALPNPPEKWTRGWDEISEPMKECNRLIADKIMERVSGAFVAAGWQNLAMAAYDVARTFNKETGKHSTGYVNELLRVVLEGRYDGELAKLLETQQVSVTQ